MGDTGAYFEIRNIEKFTYEILSKQFKTSNYYSFIRQLNFYGFSKIHSDTNIHCFQNVYFLKDYPELLFKITRKKVSQNNKIKQIQLGKKFLDLSFLGNEASDISQILKDFTNAINSYEGKVSFLELCHKELESRNLNLKQTLYQLSEQEKSLEKYLIFTFNNLGSNLFNRNDIKIQEKGKFSNVSNLFTKSMNVNKLVSKVLNLLELKDNYGSKRFSVNDKGLEQGLQVNGLSILKNDEFTKDISYYNNMYKRIQNDLSSNKLIKKRSNNSNFQNLNILNLHNNFNNISQISNNYSNISPLNNNFNNINYNFNTCLPLNETQNNNKKLILGRRYSKNSFCSNHSKDSRFKYGSYSPNRDYINNTSYPNFENNYMRKLSHDGPPSSVQDTWSLSLSDNNIKSNYNKFDFDPNITNNYNQEIVKQLRSNSIDEVYAACSVTNKPNDLITYSSIDENEKKINEFDINGFSYKNSSYSVKDSSEKVKRKKIFSIVKDEK